MGCRNSRQGLVRAGAGVDVSPALQGLLKHVAAGACPCPFPLPNKLLDSELSDQIHLQLGYGGCFAMSSQPGHQDGPAILLVLVSPGRSAFGLRVALAVLFFHSQTVCEGQFRPAVLPKRAPSSHRPFMRFNWRHSATEESSPPRASRARDGHHPMGRHLPTSALLRLGSSGPARAILRPCCLILDSLPAIGCRGCPQTRTRSSWAVAWTACT